MSGDEIIESMEESMRTLIGDYLKPNDTVLLVGLAIGEPLPMLWGQNLLNIVPSQDITINMLRKH